MSAIRNVSCRSVSYAAPHLPPAARGVSPLRTWPPAYSSAGGTLWRLERGDPTVALGTLATDAIVLSLDEQRLPDITDGFTVIRSSPFPQSR